ncbi:HAD-IB family phosphatase [Pyrococcus yayanosii]|uniref:phosphoserine phosphatase n=1 Tax=Pyrococcus yayanosii (strain CH1 / JCM 16557) TaxID=529709 RepID=F8AG08_PYRYC|nr:HAD-IB family phosphatase [Pyrococcus yayanosii]AEH25062.1 phosphoserine phosphatase (serB) [Pyrococcus yayanosii CH1]
MRLAAFDLEGTLVDITSWEALHEKFGTCEKAKRNMELFFSGKISYEEWARLDASLWRGHTKEEIIELFKNVEPKPGARELFEFLRESGFKTAIISGGLMCLARRIGEMLGADYIFANELVFDEKGRITGEVIIRVNFHEKGRIMMALKEKLRPELTVAVGDWHNDVPMFKEADLSIALRDSLGADYIATDLWEVMKIIETALKNRV